MDRDRGKRYTRRCLTVHVILQVFLISLIHYRVTGERHKKRKRPQTGSKVTVALGLEIVQLRRRLPPFSAAGVKVIRGQLSGLVWPGLIELNLGSAAGRTFDGFPGSAKPDGAFEYFTSTLWH